MPLIKNINNSSREINVTKRKWKKEYNGDKRKLNVILLSTYSLENSHGSAVSLFSVFIENKTRVEITQISHVSGDVYSPRQGLLERIPWIGCLNGFDRGVPNLKSFSSSFLRIAYWVKCLNPKVNAINTYIKSCFFVCALDYIVGVPVILQ